MALQLDFYTKTYGLSPAQTKWMFLVVVWLAVFNPVMGVVADRTSTRWDASVPGCCDSFPSDHRHSHLHYAAFQPLRKLIYAWSTYLLLRLIYAANNVPYASLTGVMTDDPTSAMPSPRTAVFCQRCRIHRRQSGGSHGQIPGRRDSAKAIS